MTRDTVVRRFEVQAVGEMVLAAVDHGLRTSVAELLPDDPKALDITKTPRLPTMMTVSITGPAGAVAKAIERVTRDSSVIVRSDWLMLGGTAHDDDYPDQRALLRIDPKGVSRDVAGTGTRVVVAIVDSGLAVEHPEFKDRLWWEDIDGRRIQGARRMGRARDHEITDEDGHGTNLAGTILATANRVKGVELMTVKFFDVVTQPLAENAAQAIHFALDKGAAIINLSFDLGIGSNDLQEAIRRACKEQALVVIAAGNNGSDNDRYPAVPASYAEECRGNIITVMATDAYDEKPGFSNFGLQTVDLAAPGVGIVSTRPLISTNAAWWYGRYTGTSAAAAHVTGAAALLKSQNPNRTAQDLKRCLMNSVDRLPHLKCFSGGRLNLGRALDCKP